MIKIDTNIQSDLLLFPNCNFIDGLYEKIDKLKKHFLDKKIYMEFGKNDSCDELYKLFYMGGWEIECLKENVSENNIYYLDNILLTKPKIDHHWVFGFEDISDILEKPLTSYTLHIKYTQKKEKWIIKKLS